MVFGSWYVSEPVVFHFEKQRKQSVLESLPFEEFLEEFPRCWVVSAQKPIHTKPRQLCINPVKIAIIYAPPPNPICQCTPREVLDLWFAVQATLAAQKSRRGAYRKISFTLSTQSFPGLKVFLITAPVSSSCSISNLPKPAQTCNWITSCSLSIDSILKLKLAPSPTMKFK